MRLFIFLFSILFACHVFADLKIIALAPNLTEMVYAIGAGDELVGVAMDSDFPAEARQLPVVATYSDLDIERISSLHPNLILAWQAGNPVIALDRLKQLGMSVYVASFNHILDVSKNILAIGELTHHEIQAKKVATQFDQQYFSIQKKYSNRKPVLVFYEVSQDPLITLNQKTLMGETITLCGGKNIFSDTLGMAPHVSIENVIQLNPDVILISSQISNPASLLKQWQHYSEIKAVQKHHIYFVNADWIDRYGPRMLNGVRQVCQYMDNVR